jgi:hypothetical protein
LPPELKTSLFKIPNAQTIETVYVQLPDGRVVPRRRDEVVQVPTPPAPSDQGSKP